MDNEIISYQHNINANKLKLQKVQHILCLVLGIGSGILTLESLPGFLFYFGGITLCNAAFYFVCCEGKPKLFFTNVVQEVFFDGLFQNIAGYIMMWCLTYTLVK